MIHFGCPMCHVVLAVSDDLAGKKGRWREVMPDAMEGLLEGDI